MVGRLIGRNYDVTSSNATGIFSIQTQQRDLNADSWPIFDTVRLVSSSSGTTGAITMPTDMKKGDLAFIFQWIQSAGGAPVGNTPLNWNSLLISGGGAGPEAESRISYRIVDESETTVYIVAGATRTRWVVSVFRPNGTITSFANTYVQDTTNWQDPAGATYPTIGLSGIILLLGHAASTGAVSGKTTSPTFSEVTTSATNHWVSYYVFGKRDTKANATWDWADSGDSNIGQNIYIRLT